MHLGQSRGGLEGRERRERHGPTVQPTLPAKGPRQVLGCKVVRDTVYAMQMDEFTQLADTDKDNGKADRYNNGNNIKMSAETLTVTGSPTGHSIFKRLFAHYRIRYGQMFPDRLGNAGMPQYNPAANPIVYGDRNDGARLHFDQGVLVILRGGKGNISVTGRAFPLPGPRTPGKRRVQRRTGSQKPGNSFPPACKHPAIAIFRFGP